MCGMHTPDRVNSDDDPLERQRIERRRDTAMTPIQPKPIMASVEASGTGRSGPV